MLVIYRGLLCLYPVAYRREFGGEMALVFNNAYNDARERPLIQFAVFCAREAAGLLCGAAREHVRKVLGPDDFLFRRFDMRPEYRFPRSTVTLMLIILAGVILTIEKCAEVTMRYSGPVVTMWSTFWSFVVLAFALICLAALGGWAILFALKRSGMHRLNDVQTWPEQK